MICQHHPAALCVNMNIRRSQSKVLEAASLGAFEQWLHTHVRRCFPEQYSLLGPLRTIAIIRYGTERAREYGLSAKNDIVTYIDMILLFDLHFDAMPWAQAILQKGEKAAGRTADALSQAAEAFLKQGA
jgi:hypothetical protein